MVINHEMISGVAYSLFRDFHATLREADMYVWEATVHASLPNVANEGLNDTIVANVPVPNMF